ncbi:hypothetical protein GQ53DRAFT_771990 [Thozetella sp. PMI_491]|nr:hypothetical protein GQ53DRAFT_771990 [Thozetella sp. PMI_491]
MDNLHDQKTLSIENVISPKGTLSSTSYQVRAVAYPIQVRWKAGDVLITGIPSPSASTAPDTSSSKSSELSADAKAGLGAGLGLVGVAALGSFIWWIRRRVLARRARRQSHSSTENCVYPKAELEVPDPVNNTPQLGELDQPNREPGELPAGDAPNFGRPVELE